MRNAFLFALALLLAGQTSFAADSLGSLQAKRARLHRKLFHLHMQTAKVGGKKERKLNRKRNSVLCKIRDLDRRIAKERTYVANHKPGKEKAQPLLAGLD
jgi:hypothetical protein